MGRVKLPVEMNQVAAFVPCHAGDISDSQSLKKVYCSFDSAFPASYVTVEYLSVPFYVHACYFPHIWFLIQKSILGVTVSFFKE